MRDEENHELTLTHRLRNGHAGDPKTHGDALAAIIEKVDKLAERVAQLPDRQEVREIVTMVDKATMSTHINSCPARSSEDNSFEIGKGGLKATGKKGVLFGAVVGMCVVFVLTKVAPFVADWISAGAGK